MISRVLVISKHLLDEKDAQAQQSTALVVALANAGMVVDVITGEIDGVSLCPDLRGKNLSIHALPAKWLTTSQSIFGKIHRKVRRNLSACISTRWARHAAELAERMIEREPYDAIISIALPMESHIAAIRVKRNIPWVACLSDPWPESLLPAPYSDFSIPFLNFLQRRVVERVLNSANALVFPCAEECNFLASCYSALEREKSFVIPHVAPSILIGKKKKEEIQEKIWMVHAGSLSRERVCLGLAEAIAKLPESSRLNFKFVGGVHSDMMDALKNKGVMHRIEIIDWKPKREALEYLSGSQVGLLVEAEMKCYPFLPSKLADYSSAGCPILAITGNDSSVARLIKECDAGVVANHSSDSIFEALQKIEAGHTRNSSALLWEEFKAEKVASKYLSLIELLRTTCSRSGKV